MTILKIFAVVLLLTIVGLWVTTQIIARDIEREFPPIGDFISVNGARTHFVDISDADDVSKTAVVFVHGASGNLRDARTVYEPKLKDKARLVFLDRPGHGYSDSFEGSNDPKAQATAIAGLLDGIGVEKAVVVGHSFGGVVAGAFGVLHPEKTAGLIFLAPVSHPWYTGVDWHYDVGNIPLVGWLFSNLIATPAGSLIYPKAVKNVFRPNKMPTDYKETSGTRLVLRPRNFLENAQDVARVHSHVEAFNHRYKEIKAPTVIYHGDQDDIVSLEIHSINGLSKDIQGAELNVLEGAGHKPDYVAADQVVEDILEIIGKSDSRDAIAANESNS